MLSTFFFSALEQFDILPLIPLYFGKFDFSITNETIILFLIFLILFVYKNVLVKQSDSSFFIVPNYWQFIFESIYIFILSTVLNNIKSTKASFFFPLILAVFIYFFCLNIIGLVPYSFTLTSHFIVSFSISLSLFIGINIIGIKTNGLNFLILFIPSGTSKLLAFLLVPIELLSYLSKPVSLSIRLFANMMGGHVLLKVFGGFSFTLMSCTGLLYVLHYIPLLFLIPLFGLELAVAIIQSFVFCFLISIYLNDAINLH